MRTLLGLFSLLALTVVVCGSIEVEAEFRGWLRTHQKKYSSVEYSKRLQIFSDNKHFIETHNANPSRTYDVAINKFADLTLDEFRATHLQAPTELNCFPKQKETLVKRDIPTQFDWGTTGNIPSLYNDEQCGSIPYTCVANQVSAAISIAAQKPPVKLSPQQMMDCDPKGGEGCNGAWPWPLYDYIAKVGLESEASYPYRAVDSKCKFNKTAVIGHITGYVNVTGEDQMLQAVYSNGPLVSQLDVENGFMFYSSGVYYDTQCSQKDINHVLVITGYGQLANGTTYWNAQNQWGTEWGLNGYIWIGRGKNVCGTEQCCSYVTGATSSSDKN